MRNEVEPATWTCGEGLSFRRELDDLLTEEAQCITMVHPGESMPWGLLQKLELKQRQTLELIKSAREPNAELISSLRLLACDANKDLEFVVSEIRQAEHN